MKHTLEFPRPMHRLKYKQRIKTLIKNPLFWSLTAIGIFLIIVGSVLLFHFESPPTLKPPLQPIDALLWSTSLVTTIGISNYSPETFFGKLTVVALMLSGTLFVWSYMAFLVTALIAPELTILEKEVMDIEKNIQNLNTENKKTKNQISLKG